jgi:hypothetical protein
MRDWIDIVDTIRCQEEKAFIVLKNTEKNGDEFVAFEIVG